MERVAVRGVRGSRGGDGEGCSEGSEGVKEVRWRGYWHEWKAPGL